MDPQPIDKVDESATEKKGLNKRQVLTIIAIAFIGSALSMGPSKFFVGLGIAPVDTLASVVGISFVPLLVSLLVALLVAKLSKLSMYKAWVGCLLIMLVVMIIGAIRGAT
jgi:hypothetical protein